MLGRVHAVYNNSYRHLSIANETGYSLIPRPLPQLAVWFLGSPFLCEEERLETG